MISEAIERHPGIDGRSTPRGIDQSDGNLFLFSDLSTEEVGDCGKLASSFRGALRPLALQILEGDIRALAPDQQ